MTWGNNDGTIDWVQTGAPNERLILDRVWRIDEVGTVGTVYLSVPDDSSTLTSKLPKENTTILLITDADGDFSDGNALETALTLNGTNWELPAGIDLADGTYFTVSTLTPEAPGGVAGSLALWLKACLLYTSPSPRAKRQSRMPSSA